MNARFTLGGRLTLSIATLWALGFGVHAHVVHGRAIGQEHNNVIAVISGLVTFVTSFPLGLASNLLLKMSPSTEDAIMYHLLLIPNFFLLGYGTAALRHLMKNIWNSHF